MRLPVLRFRPCRIGGDRIPIPRAGSGVVKTGDFPTIVRRHRWSVAGPVSERAVACVSVLRIFIISGVRLYCDGIADALSRQGLLVVGVHGGGRDVIAHVSAARPDVVLLEMAMAHSLATARDVQQNVPGVAVVALGVGGSDAELLAYAEAGISGYVAGDATVSELVMRIESAARGELVCPPSLIRGLVRRLAVLAAERGPEPRAVKLTGRERQIAELLERELSNKEIAVTLGIEVATVKHHVHNLLEKLSVSRRRDAVRVLRRVQRGIPTLLPRGDGQAPVVIQS